MGTRISRCDRSPTGEIDRSFAASAPVGRARWPGSFGRRWRAAWSAGAFLVASIGASTSARAADEDPMLPRLVALEASVATHVAAKGYDGLLEDVAAALAIAKENAQKEPHRERVLRVLGAIAKTKQDEVAKAAILALGETGDRHGAKHLRAFLRPVQELEIPVVVGAAIEASGKIPDDTLAEPLLAIVNDSKNFAAAAKAITALGAFGKSKAKREKIFETLLKSVVRNQPGGVPNGDRENVANPDGGLGQQTRDGSGRWKTLSPVLPAALNQLTGRNEATVDGWSSTVKAVRGKISDLFLEAAESPGG
jgi:hypothetical protein